MQKPSPIHSNRGFNLVEIHKQYGNFIIDVIRLHGVKSVEDAIDIRQDIYTALFQASIKQRLPSNANILKSYIYRATANMVTDFRRTQRRENIAVDWVQNGKDIIGVKMDAKTFREWWNINEYVHTRILKAIEFLDDYKPVDNIWMKDIITDIYNGISYSEIANKYQIPVGTLKVWIHRFRDRLKEHMRKPKAK